MSSRIAVVGSINADLFIRMPQLPGRGETVSGGVPDWFPGGKGANQAVAASRLGGTVSMFGAVGNDEPGTMALANLRDAGTDLSKVIKVDIPTSIALVMVEESGENQIVVATGANDHVSFNSGDLETMDAVLCQLEVPDAVIQQAANACTGLFCVNAAPVRELPESIMNRIDVLIVNEHEFEAYGRPTHGVVVVTAGAGEAIVYQDGQIRARAFPPMVDAVDTVGAGDTFCGAFVVSLTQGHDVQHALEYACAAAALSTLSNGAQTGMPTAAEVTEFINAQATTH